MIDQTAFVRHITPCDWLKTPDNGPFPTDRYFCIVRGPFTQCSYFKVFTQPVTVGDNTAFEEFSKIGESIVGDGYIILFTKGLEVPGCVSITFARQCIRL